MDAADFIKPTGQLVKTAAGNLAFVPNPLPPSLTYSPGLVNALSAADSALAELSGLARTLPHPELFIAPYARREAVLSSQIEGTQASLNDLFLEELVSAQEAHGDVREVINHVRAQEHGIELLKTLPLSLRLVCEVHSVLMTGVRGDNKAPGEFRRIQNFIGPPGTTEKTAVYVPPPVPQMHESLNEWERFINERESLPPLIQCALMHAQFESIHPFVDGNGRVGRLLITMFLLERQRLYAPLLYLSAFIEAHRRDYYELLQRVRTHGAWDEWILFFLAGITDVARDAIKQASALLELREELRGDAKSNPYLLTLIDELFVNPYITRQRAAAAIGKTYPTATKHLQVLVDRNVLRETSGRKWGQVFVAQPILDVLAQASTFGRG